MSEFDFAEWASVVCEQGISLFKGGETKNLSKSKRSQASSIYYKYINRAT